MKTLKARTPIIPLSYSERHKAQPKELLIDYDNGNIYVVSAHDKSIIFDITAKIYEQLENMSGDNIEITIEGVGTVKISEILEKLQQGINDTIQAIETGEEVVYVSKENVLDGKSLNVENKKIQLKGFSAAETHMIPRKGEDGNLEWINMPKLPDLGTGGVGGSGSAADDGEITEVHIIEPTNDKLYLRASKRQKSVNLSRNCMVILPRVLDAYAEITWYVRTNSFAPMLKFGDNVVWANSADTQPEVNAHQMYKFISLDAGETWLGELVHYSKAVKEEVVYVSYLEGNYYTRNHIDDNHYNKVEVDDRIRSINTLDPSDYYNKSQINDNFYNKVEVDAKVESVRPEPVDLSNYYNKVEVDNKINSIPVVDTEPFLTKVEAVNAYYNKSQIDVIARDTYNNAINNPVIPSDVVRDEKLVTNYYNKLEVDGLVDSVIDLIPDEQDLSAYVTNTTLTENYYNKVEVDSKLAEVTVPDVDLSGYVTDVKLQENYYDKLQVDEKIAGIETPEVDLSGYVTDTSLQEGYYNKVEVDAKISAIPEPDLSEYPTNTDITTNYYNKTEIDTKLEAIDNPDVDLSEYVTNTTLTENYYDKVEVDAKISSVEVSGVDLSNYYTKQEIDDNFYDVGEADEKFYDKNKINEYVQFLDDKHYDKDETEVMMSWQIEGVDLNPINEK